MEKMNAIQYIINAAEFDLGPGFKVTYESVDSLTLYNVFINGKEVTSFSHKVINNLYEKPRDFENLISFVKGLAFKQNKEYMKFNYA